MKIYISADIEGITGVTHWDETNLAKSEYEPFREQMTTEVIAACEGALQAGASEIWVKDAHDSGRNLIGASLPHEVRLVRGWSGHPLMMVQELDETFHAAMFIGYHSRAGANTSPLAHTMSGGVVQVTINDQAASEFMIHALAAAYFKVPVVFVSGDKGLCDEVNKINPHIVTVAVKEGIGNSTINIHPHLAINRIREGVIKALQSDVIQCLQPLPEKFKVNIQYKDLSKAYLNGWYPGAQQINSNTVQFVTDSYFDVMRFILFAV
jgi:D-amino peptidase